jgi:hypothetical protein
MNGIGHLFGGFFQLGYVTRNLDRAIESYKARFGHTDFLTFPTPESPGVPPVPMSRIALAYIDSVMIELIEVKPEITSIYSDVLPMTQEDIALHHLGFLIPDHEAMLKMLEAGGHAVKWAGTSGETMDYIYADTRKELGTYAEFIHLYPAGEAFFASVPRNNSRLQ